MDELGGVGTAGLIAMYWYGFETGFTAEIDQALGVNGRKWNPIQKAEWLRSELMKNGGRGVVPKLWLWRGHAGQ
jgi:hypothetical protein